MCVCVMRGGERGERGGGEREGGERRGERGQV